MAQERLDLTSREKQIRELGPEHNLNLKAAEAVLLIEEALESQSGSIAFTIFPYKPPIFITELIFYGVAGLDVDMAFLDKKSGKYVYREKKISLRYGRKDVMDSEEFFRALPAKDVSQIRFSFNAAPRGTTPSILEDPHGRIVLQGVKITSWEEKTP